MELAFALMTQKALHFSPQHYLQMYIQQQDKPVDKSLGEDRFDYNGILLPHSPVAATGRKVLHSIASDMAGYQDIWGTPVPIASADAGTDELPSDISLHLDNNLILSQGELQTCFTLLIMADGQEIFMPLDTPLMEVDWLGKGVFHIRPGKSGWNALIG